MVGSHQSVTDSIIVKVGLSVGNIAKMLSTSIPAGNVISQVPEAGIRVPLGTVVNLVISSGLVTNVAVSKTSTADSEESSKGNTADKGNDGDSSTRWCARNGDDNHWWKVDLGSSYNLVGSEVIWELEGQNYKYIIEVSKDNANWNMVVDKRNNTSTAQTQQDVFTATASKYVRITVTGLSAANWASFWEFKAFVSETSDVDKSKGIPTEYKLDQNYPNPFNPSTRISYALKEKSKVQLFVYDMLGREIEILVNEMQDTGYYNLSFASTGLTSGIYFYRLRAGNNVFTKKMMVIR